jgi:hypothetical protein
VVIPPTVHARPGSMPHEPLLTCNIEAAQMFYLLLHVCITEAFHPSPTRSMAASAPSSTRFANTHSRRLSPFPASQVRLGINRRGYELKVAHQAKHESAGSPQIDPHWIYRFRVANH